MARAVEAVTRRQPPRRHRVDWGNVAAYAALTGWLLFTLFPIAWIVLSSLKQSADVFAMPPKWLFAPTAENYQLVLGIASEPAAEAQAGSGDASQFPRTLLNTTLVALGTTAVSLSLGSAAAYALTRFYQRSRTRLLVGIMMTRLVPPVVLVIPMYVLWRNLNLLDTHLGLVLAYLSVGLPFAIWMMRGFLLDIPVDLEEAAMIDGASRFQALRRVVLPLAAPGMATTAIFTILIPWNDLLYALVLSTDRARTITPFVGTFITDKAVLWGRLYAASALVLLPVLVFALAVQKHLARGLTGGGVKG